MLEPLGKFVPRETPTWMFAAGEPLVLLPALAIWGAAGWATFEVVRGSVVLGVAGFLVWLPAFLLVARELHRRGRVRFGVSVATTAVVVLAAAAVADSFV
jgi:hypothetical protein